MMEHYSKRIIDALKDLHKEESRDVKDEVDQAYVAGVRDSLSVAIKAEEHD